MRFTASTLQCAWTSFFNYINAQTFSIMSASVRQLCKPPAPEIEIASGDYHCEIVEWRAATAKDWDVVAGWATVGEKKAYALYTGIATFSTIPASPAQEQEWHGHPPELMFNGSALCYADFKDERYRVQLKVVKLTPPDGIKLVCIIPRRD